MSKPMSLLLIEDNQSDCIAFEKAINSRTDMKLVGFTNSSYEGLDMVKTHSPEGIVLDIELNKGKGSGIDFLIELNKMYLSFKPLIFVTTNTSTNKLYHFLHNNGVDLIFYKHQENYSIEKILSTFMMMRETICGDNGEILSAMVSPNDLKNKIFTKIDTEMDLIGIPHNLLGREYIREAVYYLIGPDHNDNNDTAFNYLSKKYNIASGSISRAMETAINKAWYNTPVDELNKYYTAKIRYDRGTPSAAEFVYYYFNKIKRFLSD